MSKRSIIHMIDPMAYVSPFDINMAVDAGYDVVIPYANVELWQVNGLLQDTIFSREPKGVKKYSGLYRWTRHGFGNENVRGSKEGDGTSL